MKVTEFIQRVREMRDAQKKYFKGGRLQGDLIRAKGAEAVVDTALAQGIEIEPVVLPMPTDAETRQLELEIMEHIGDLDAYHKGEEGVQ